MQRVHMMHDLCHNCLSMACHIVSLALACFLRYAAGLQCYDCHNITDLNSCEQTVSCSQTQSCYMEAITQTNGQWAYDLSCKEKHHCCPFHLSGNVVGRSAGYVRNMITKRDAPCHECCSTDLCNRALCNHQQPSNCVDDKSVDCAKMNSIFSICANVHQAKLVCSRFCDLCNLVDGNWNNWSTWSGFDVTCGNGIRSRDRTCTNPSPQNGGLNCVGQASDSETCNLGPCPVHGGWSQWSPWGSCSVTCDIGMQRRDRSCDNPYPSLGGDHCFGDNRDDRICFKPGCTNGNWSPWQPWGPCSATCFGGHRSRYRVCNNPYPSILGHFCEGSAQDIDSCNGVSCGDGGWSVWKGWGSCTKTCDTGYRTRIRQCDNPTPSFVGRYCNGSHEDTKTCNNVPCSFGSFGSFGSSSSSSGSSCSACCACVHGGFAGNSLTGSSSGGFGGPGNPVS